MGEVLVGASLYIIKIIDICLGATWDIWIDEIAYLRDVYDHSIELSRQYPRSVNKNHWKGNVALSDKI